MLKGTPLTNLTNEWFRLMKSAQERWAWENDLLIALIFLKEGGIYLDIHAVVNRNLDEYINVFPATSDPSRGSP